MGVATAAVVVGAVGLISGFLGSRKASKAAKKQAKLEAEAERQITTERIREIGKEERALYGETVSGYVGGGVLAGFGGTGQGDLSLMGSSQQVIQEQVSEFAHERDITKKVGATKVAAGLARGKATADAYKWAGYSNAATGVSNLLTSYAATK
jgi:hypothetical protein